jgi:uncharacterized membrane protein YdjX (TVP38/TMEM64 family)
MEGERKYKIIAGSLVLGLAIGFYFVLPPYRLFVQKAFQVLSQADVRALRDYLLSFGIWAPTVSGLLMVFQSIIAPLPAFVITFTNGLLFGVWWGTLLSWSSAMVGAAACFYISQVFGRPVVEKLAGGSRSLDMVDGFFKRYGRHAILVARLLPFVPFDPISYGAGLTSMRFWEFWIATGIGQLPATIVYSYLGQSMTGTVKVVFWVFVVVIAIAIIGAALRSRFLPVVGGQRGDSSVAEPAQREVEGLPQNDKSTTRREVKGSE